MTVMRALENSSNSLGSDRRESAILQELHRYCPNFAMTLRGNFAAIQYWPDRLVAEGGVHWTVAMTVQWSSITIPHARADGNESIRHNSPFILCCNYHLAPMSILWHEENHSGWGGNEIR